MKNSTLSMLLFAVIAILLLGSCSTNSDLSRSSVIKKRRYMKGYQVNIKRNNKTNKNEMTTDRGITGEEPIASIRPGAIAGSTVQASLSTKITEADVAPHRSTPTGIQTDVNQNAKSMVA